MQYPQVALLSPDSLDIDDLNSIYQNVDNQNRKRSP